MNMNKPAPAALLGLSLMAALLGCAGGPGFGDVIFGQVEIGGHAGGRTEIPIRVDNGIPLVAVDIPGVESRYFIFDTGSSFTIITDALIDEIGIEPTAVHKVRGEKERIKAEAYLLPKMKIGDLFLDGVSAYRREDTDIEWLRGGSGSGPGTRVGGILGWTVFRDFMVTIDYGRGVLSLESPFPSADAYREAPHLYEHGSHPIQAARTIVTRESYTRQDEAGEAAYYLPFIWRQDKVTLPVRVEGVEKALLFVVDTGGSSNLIRHDLIDPAKREEATPVQIKIGLVKGIETIDTKRIRATLHIGSPPQIECMEDLLLENVDFLPASHGPSMMDGILGAPFLNKYAVTIDRKNRMIILRTARRPPGKDSSEESGPGTGGDG